MIVGYARVSTKLQNLDLQTSALKAAGCEKIYEEKMSGRSMKRPVLSNMLRKLKRGDTLIVWKLDRIGRNVLNTLLYFQKLHDKGVNVKSITDLIDLSTAAGRYNFRNILSAAQYEADVNHERTMAGLEAARKRGNFGGRPSNFSNHDAARAEWMLKAGVSYQSLAHEFGVSVAHLYKLFPKNGKPPKKPTT